MLQHCVLLLLKDPDNLSVLDEPMVLISGLVDKLSGVLSVTHGPNLDLEGKSKPFQYGFIVTVSSEAVLADYAPHPDHQKAAAMLIAACEGGADGILVADIRCG